MDNKEKAERCRAAGYDVNGKLVERCRVYSRWIGHDLSVYDGCADCSFATLSRMNDKPMWRG